jgi:hypothetical protein
MLDFNTLQSKAVESTLYNYLLHYVKFSNLRTERHLVDFVQMSLGSSGGSESGRWQRVEGWNFEFMQMRWVIGKVMKVVILPSTQAVNRWVLRRGDRWK